MNPQVVEVYRLPKLFGTSKDGKTKEWEISVERFENYSEIVTLHGYTNKIESRRKIDKGKNLNKSNATTHFTQAKLEAQSKWNKKHDVEKYTPEEPRGTEERGCDRSGEDRASGKRERDEPVSNQSSGPKLPMLAQDFNKHKSKVKYPCFLQPKLDGYRMIYDSTKKSMTTRQGHTFDAVKDSGKLFSELSNLNDGFVLDGELYVHGVSFESLGVLRKTKRTSKDKEKLAQLEYHVYDMISEDPFEVRFSNLQKLLGEGRFEKIKLVPTFKIEKEQEIGEFHQKFNSDGYEGTMVRNAKSKYLEKNRSYDLLKYKDFMDAEFPIAGFSFEKDVTGEDKNCIVWVVEVKPGLPCKVRPRGERQQRQKLLEECESNFEKYKGRKLWTKFFEYTTDGSLRFPTTKTEDVETYIRDVIV
jgi:ATP-dependent DNA ligase